MANPKKVYWDSCVWLTLINGETGSDRCEYIIDCAKKGEIQIWTSSLTLAEVYKAKCDGNPRHLAPTEDIDFEKFIEQQFVFEVQVDHEIGIQARRLCRAHSPPLKKPNDAIHLASAIVNNVDEFHTFDNKNLLPLNGQIKRADGKLLEICEPPIPPPPLPANLEMFVSP